MRWRRANYKTWAEIKKELPDVIRNIDEGETYWFDILQTFDNSLEYALVVGYTNTFSDDGESYDIAIAIACESCDAGDHEYGWDWHLPMVNGECWDTELRLYKEDADNQEYINKTIDWFEEQWNKMAPYLEAQMYEPKPIDIKGIHIPTRLGDLIERVAESQHDIRCLVMRNNGWTWGPKRDIKNKEHPCLVPYDDLPEEEPIERGRVEEIVKEIIALGYKIERDW